MRMLNDKYISCLHPFILNAFLEKITPYFIYIHIKYKNRTLKTKY